MTAVTTIPVPDEASAWQLLHDAISDKLPDGTIQLEFGDWPVLHLKYKGERFDSSLTTSVMEGFIELQQNIYRLFAKLNYNDSRSRVLTLDQRKALEIMIKVNPGCSELSAFLNFAIEKITSGAINKMEAKHWVIILLAGILGLTSSSVCKSYLQSQNEIKQTDLKVSLSREETKRLEIMASAVRQVPYVASMHQDAEEVKNKFLKSTRSADSIVISGQEIQRDQALKLVRKPRAASIECRLDGEYRIIKVDSSDIDHFTVVVMGRDGKSFHAVLQNDTVSKSRNMERLQEAEWKRNYISLEINGREVRGEVTTATILGIKHEI